MFQTLSEVADQVATSVSRRAFVGKLGQGALAVISAGVFSVLSPKALADGNLKCCRYWSEASGFFCECHSGSCPKLSGAKLVDRFNVYNCSECYFGGYG
jgi:hypothetical protein